MRRRPSRPAFAAPVLLATLLTLSALTGNATASPTTRPLEAGGTRIDLALDRVTPEAAYRALGDQIGCAFVVADGAAWAGPDVGVSVSVDLKAVPFWTAVLELGHQSGYEPAFEPHGETLDGRPTISLSRIDVVAEEEPRPAVVAGPLLLRTRRAYFFVSPERARRMLTLPQIALDVEVFTEPGLAPKYVTFANLRGSGDANSTLVRSGVFDPSVGVSGGTGLATLHFDVHRGKPEAVVSWQAVLTLVAAKRTIVATTTMPVEEVVISDASVSTTAQHQPPRMKSAVGLYVVRFDSLRVMPRGDGAGRSAHARFVLERGTADTSDWMRLYGQLQSEPPRLSWSDEQEIEATSSLVSVQGYVGGPDVGIPRSLIIQVRYVVPPPLAAIDQVRLSWSVAVNTERVVVSAMWANILAIEPTSER